jgi:hypothetical protein
MKYVGLTKQKLPAGNSKSARKLSHERMRIVLDALRERPILSDAADKAGIHRKALEYWMKNSETGHDGYDVEWQGLTSRFHEHCQSAIDEAHDRLLAVVWNIARGVISKTDPFLVDLGYQGADAYAKDENGDFIVEVVGRPNPKMIRFFLELVRPETWGKNQKIDIPQKGGVVVIGESTEALKNNSAASSKVRKSCSRKIRE